MVPGVPGVTWTSGFRGWFWRWAACGRHDVILYRLSPNSGQLELIMSLSLAADVMKRGFQCVRTYSKPGFMTSWQTWNAQSRCQRCRCYLSPVREVPVPGSDNKLSDIELSPDVFTSCRLNGTLEALWGRGETARG